MLVLHKLDFMHYVVKLDRSTHVMQAEVLTQYLQTPLQKNVKQKCQMILKFEEKIRFLPYTTFLTQTKN